MAELGILPALRDPFGHTEARAAWANRMMQAHANAVENRVIFDPLVLRVQMTGQNSALTAQACVIYFVARLVRVAHFLTGFYARAVLALSVLRDL